MGVVLGVSCGLVCVCGWVWVCGVCVCVGGVCVCGGACVCVCAGGWMREMSCVVVFVRGGGGG